MRRRCRKCGSVRGKGNWTCMRGRFRERPDPDWKRLRNQCYFPSRPKPATTIKFKAKLSRPA